jgi:hypothetical protein
LFINVFFRRIPVEAANAAPEWLMNKLERRRRLEMMRRGAEIEANCGVYLAPQT